MTNSSRPWRASAKRAQPALALADAPSMDSPLAARAGIAERYASKPRQRAEDLICDAWEAAGARRAMLAREALALWPNCADAYVLLAQAASSLEQARGLLEQASPPASERSGPARWRTAPVSSG